MRENAPAVCSTLAALSPRPFRGVANTGLELQPLKAQQVQTCN